MNPSSLRAVNQNAGARVPVAIYATLPFMDMILGMGAAALVILAFWGFTAALERVDLFIATTREKTRRVKQLSVTPPPVRRP